MQTLRSTTRRIPQTLNRITKTTKLPRIQHFHNTSAAMSLFPRFTQEFSPIFRLLDDYDRATRHAIRGVEPSIRSFSPKFDVKETNEAYELHGEFPGIEQKNINIEWSDGNTLTISGRHETVREEGRKPQAIEAGATESEHAKDKEHQPTVEDEGADSNNTPAATEQNQVATRGNQEVGQHDEQGTKFWVSERSVGEFHRSFSFPARVDQDAVKASLKDGILSIVVPKAKAQQPRKINIE